MLSAQSTCCRPVSAPPTVHVTAEVAQVHATQWQGTAAERVNFAAQTPKNANTAH